jgi:CheY-like chemotaxis protein
MSFKVHVIDDDERSRRLATDVLVAQGFEVHSAETGATARANLAAHEADLVLLDIQLPDTDGFELIAWIREQPALAGLPVVALTASVMPAYRGRLDSAGFSGFIAKPISSVRAFVQTVRGFLPKGAGV